MLPIAFINGRLWGIVFNIVAAGVLEGKVMQLFL